MNQRSFDQQFGHTASSLEKALTSLNILKEKDFQVLVVTVPGKSGANQPNGGRDHQEGGRQDQDRILAWGIVLTSDSKDIERETPSSLVEKWEVQADRLEALSIERATISAQSLITPSCGTGSLTQSHAVKVLEMTREVSRSLRSQS